MKVTKAKGLNTHWVGSIASNPRTASIQLKRSLAAEAMHPRTSMLRIEPASFGGFIQAARSNRIEPLCFAYFHLGPQMKVGRPPAETGALSRGEQAKP
jgi:hypothetical protein